MYSKPTFRKRNSWLTQHQGEELSFCAESLRVQKPEDSSSAQSVWADVPMRAFAGGFYQNLIRLYDYLGVPYQSQDFIFTFTQLDSRRISDCNDVSSAAPSMTHASNFHRIPPIPRTADIFFWLLEALYALFFNLWFTLCVYYVAPYEETSSSQSETFRDYIKRTYLPRYYVDNYLLPLMASVSTCSHEELLDFPASDILEYKRRTHRQPHYVVKNGVRAAQDRLAQDLNVLLKACVQNVVPGSNGIALHYIDAAGEHKVENFDLVVLAVSPDVVSAVFEPLRETLRRIPTTTVQTVAHNDMSTLPRVSAEFRNKNLGATDQMIHFRSSKGTTEAIHEQEGRSLIVTTNPITPIKPSRIMRSAKFTRVLRSPESRRIVNEIFADRATSGCKKPTVQWHNGDDGVFIAGGWCWDGMVLLEGCVVSAMRVASSLDVEIPWMSR